MIFRSKLLNIAGVIFFALIYSSCCKVYCVKESLYIRFIHFNNSDIESILFTAYTKNGLYNSKLDSFEDRRRRPQADTISSYFNDNIDVDKDYIIKLKNIDRSYKLSGIRTRSENCSCGSGRSKTVTAYTLDGIEKTSEFIDLVK